MRVKVSIHGVEKWQAFIRDLPKRVIKAGMLAFGEWIIGTPERGFKKYQKYKYITRKKAYGKTFVSDKQRRYVMAAIREGRIDPGVPHRTGRTQRDWAIKVEKNGYKISVMNKEKGAYYTRHETGQARLNALAGWKKIGEIIKKELNGAFRHATAAINKLLKNKK